MLVSYVNKFIFTKTVKTAGTSVEVFFEKYCFPIGEWKFSHAREEYINEKSGIIGYRGSDRPKVTFYNHMPAAEIQNNLSAEVWDEYFKFTVIRNPFDKMVSAFFHFEKFGNRGKYLNDNDNDISRFRKWVQEGAAILDRSAYLIDGKVALDYFIRYEHLKEDTEFVCKKIGVEFNINDLRTLKSEYRDKTISLKDMYDEKTEAIVRNLYKFEIEYFDYQLN